MRILFVCTGNAARSVMAGAVTEHLAEAKGLDLHVATAGTHSMDGRPVSQRTRDALLAIDPLSESALKRHRSHQVTTEDLDAADLVIVMERDHLRYLRKRNPRAATKLGMFKRLVRTLKSGPLELSTRIQALHLGDVMIDDEEVFDPAGLDEAHYDLCAKEIVELCSGLVDLLG
jgi:protein-tyrosine phosphatase